MRTLRRRLPRWYAFHLVWCSLGRRGAFLAWLALLDTVIGWSLIAPASLPTGRAAQSYRVALQLTGGRWWPLAIPWLAAALVAGTQAFARRDMIAFAVCIGLKLWWALLLGASWLLYHAYRGWVNVVIWGTFAAVVAIISGWAEPPLHLERCARYRNRCPRARAELRRRAEMVAQLTRGSTSGAA